MIPYSLFELLVRFSVFEVVEGGVFQLGIGIVVSIRLLATL